MKEKLTNAVRAEEKIADIQKESKEMVMIVTFIDFWLNNLMTIKMTNAPVKNQVIKYNLSWNENRGIERKVSPKRQTIILSIVFICRKSDKYFFIILDLLCDTIIIVSTKDFANIKKNKN